MHTTCPSLKTLTIALTTVAVLSGAVMVSRPSLALAQEAVLQAGPESLSLTATPLRVGDDNSILIKPGEKKQVTVRVTNTSDQTLNVFSSAQDFVVEEDDGTPVPIEGEADQNNRWSLASWLTITPGQAVLKPRETSQISVLIEAPADALPGGHYAMITHQPSTDLSLGLKDNFDAASGINQRVGTLLYVSVDGPINEEAYIRDFKIPQFQEFGPVPYSFTLDNRSDIHIHPQIGITVTNMFGQQVGLLQPTPRILQSPSGTPHPQNVRTHQLARRRRMGVEASSAPERATFPIKAARFPSSTPIKIGPSPARPRDESDRPFFSYRSNRPRTIS